MAFAFRCALILLAGLLQAQEIRLIVQGDDMGAGHGVNTATVKAYRDGIVRATNVLAPAAWVPEAAQLLAENSGLDVGVHLTLTSEWERVKWRPLTYAPSLVDANGYFFPMVVPSKNFPAGMNLRDAKLNLAEIEKELRAQIELVKKLVPRASYLWPHMGFPSLSPEIRELVARLAADYKMPVPGPEMGLQFLGGVWSAQDSGEARATKLAERLSKLGPGTWLMVEHAAEDTPEIRAFGHKGYENVAADRAAVTYAWTHPKVLAVVRQRGIRLIGYRELAARGR